jgi:hypothetical protein
VWDELNWAEQVLMVIEIPVNVFFLDWLFRKDVRGYFGVATTIDENRPTTNTEVP